MDMVDASNSFKMDCPKCGQSVRCPLEIQNQFFDCPGCAASIQALPPPKPNQLQPIIAPAEKRAWTSEHTMFAVVGSVLALLAIGAMVFLKYFGDMLFPFALSGLKTGVAFFIVVFVLLWAVLWLLFPVFVYFGMNRMEKLLKQIERNTRQK